MSGQVLGVSVPMFTSVASGSALFVLMLSVFLVGLSNRGWKRTRLHRTLAWILMAASVLHGAWGLVAVFVLKS
jgi:cytochrome b561